MKHVTDWLKAGRQSADGKQPTCPSCGAASIECQYVGDIHTRIGYADIWCNSCNRGVHVSRARAPDHVDLLPMGVPEAVLRQKIPEYEPIEFEDIGSVDDR